MIEVEINNDQLLLEIDEGQIKAAVNDVLSREGIESGVISLAVVDGPAIRALNARWLQHDYATDVLSFLIEQDGNHLEGDMVISAEMAVEMARQYKWPAQAELLLYVIHGCLHLVGYDDTTDKAKEVMRQRERHYLLRFGFEPVCEENRTA